MLHHVVRVEAGAELTLLENGPAAARFNKVHGSRRGRRRAFHHVRAQGRDHERLAQRICLHGLAQEVELQILHPDCNGRADPQRGVIELTGDDAERPCRGRGRRRR